jgi:hypothetical protein
MIDALIKQANELKKAIDPLKAQNSIFENLISEAIKGADEETKEKVNSLKKHAIEEALKGNYLSQDELLKKFVDVSKNNQS